MARYSRSKTHRRRSRRRVAVRRPKKTLRVFCEGERTEPDYLRALRSDPSIREVASVEIQMSKHTIGITPPLTLVEEAVGSAERVSQERGEVDEATPIVLLTPQGQRFEQCIAEELVEADRLVLICGRYEGVDERVRQHLATRELSVGDYVISGGELAALIVIDAVSRLVPGVVGTEGATEDDSHTSGLLQFPQYTRPATFRGWSAPEVLLSGDHARVARWRRRESLSRTLARRPDMLGAARLSDDDRRVLDELGDRG